MNLSTIPTRHQNVRYTDIDGVRWYSQRDVLIIAHEKVNKANLCRKNKEQCNFKTVKVKTPGGNQDSVFIDHSTLEFLSDKTNSTFIREILTDLGVAVPKRLSRYKYKECFTLDHIKKCIPLDWQMQYTIKNYRLDMYNRKYNIVVECDEDGHSGRDPIYEKARTQYVDTVLVNPKWIRYNPDEPEFDIADVVGKIFILIMSS